MKFNIFLLLTLGLIINSSSQEFISQTTKLISAKDENQGEKDTATYSSIDDWLNIETISLYGGGSLLGLVTGETDLDEATSPSGSIGLNLATNRITSSIYYSYNGRKTVELNSIGQFGNALMNPDLSGHSFTFSALGRIHRFFGISTKFQIADNLWQIDNNETIDASPLIFRLGLYLRPFDFNSEEQNKNEINLTFNVHYTHRSILGDFNNNDQIIDGNTISSKGYNGIDFSINTYLNSVHIYVQFSRNSNKDNIPGFSGSQVLFGINVTGNLIKIKENN